MRSSEADALHRTDAQDTQDTQDMQDMQDTHEPPRTQPKGAGRLEFRLPLDDEPAPMANTVKIQLPTDN